MSGTGWLLPHHEQTVDGHWVSVRRRHGQSTVDGLVIQTCDVAAVNGLVHAIDSFLPSALRHHGIMPTPRRHRADIWTILNSRLVD